MLATKFLWEVGSKVAHGSVAFILGKITVEQLEDHSYRVTFFDKSGKARSYLPLVEREHPDGMPESDYDEGLDPFK
jgi:hypothetical protein